MTPGWSAPIYPVVILKSWLCLPLLVGLYGFARFWARRDPAFLVVFFRHLQQKEYYHA
jgi:type IV secretory pathway TrbD component